VARNPTLNAITPYISFERPMRQRKRGSWKRWMEIRGLSVRNFGSGAPW
jgi:hypothetical protein